MSNVPPERQCTLPTCEREAVDLHRSASLCQEYLDGIEKERETSDDETAVKADVLTVNPDGEQNPGGEVIST